MGAFVRQIYLMSLFVSRNVAVWETAAKTAAVRFETVTARANPKPSLIKLKYKVYVM